MQAVGKTKIESYQDLRVWQKSMDLVVQCYKTTQKLPTNEQFGLTAQIRRAAVSIPANIAEGFGRWHRKEFVRFLLVANGSLKELQTHFLVCQRLGLLQATEVQKLLSLIEEIGKMFAGLRQKLANKRG